MNRGPVIFFSALTAFAVSFGAFVLAPQMQLGCQTPAAVAGTADVYPHDRVGLAKRGAEIYRANGCAYCHSQQVRQTGTEFAVLLTDAGTNQTALVAALAKMNSKLDAAKLSEARLPQPVLSGVAEKSTADAAQQALTAAGAQAVVRSVPTGADLARGWGLRRSVAADYLYDTPALPGLQRIGPDLANVGLRLPDAAWQLRHLYQPQVDVKGSTMPPYHFLFEKRKIVFHPAASALNLPVTLAPAAGFEIVPTDDALALVAYLQSLHQETPLFEAPMTP